ncbi:MAG: MFS transporter [Paracoccaceae bacterium]
MAARLPRTVVALGFVSLFMDFSSEMIHGLLPLFLTGTLGASVAMVGLIEGLGEAVAQIVKVFSGAISDRFGRRKPLIVLGYGLAALTKPVFAMAGAPATVLAARLADRLGKGIRGAPRDALVADLVPEDRRGAAYGLRQSMDTIGAVLGPLAAMALMLASGGDIRRVFALAILPAAAALAILLMAVREPPAANTSPPHAGGPRFNRAALGRLGRPFHAVVALGVALTLARLTEAFLILRIAGLGLAPAFAPLALVALSAVYALVAWPAGALSDRIGRRHLLTLSLGVLVLAHLALSLANGLPAAFLGLVLWGLHMGLSQGLLSAEIARTVPAELRGTGFGLFNLATGLATLVAGAGAGLFWSGIGPAATFGIGAGLAFLAMCLAAAARLRG